MRKFQKTAIAAAVAHVAVLSSTAAWAQTTGDTTAGQVPTVVHVSGQRAALQSAQKLKQDADEVVDSIVAEDIGQFPDKSIGEAVARIAGVALDVSDSGEAGGFTIRGQSADLIRVEVDGMTVLDNTTGQGGRSAQLNELSSDLIKSVDVVKGQTASSSYKPAILSNGIRTLVPPHITAGTRVVIATEDGSYVERAKD